MSTRSPKLAIALKSCSNCPFKDGDWLHQARRQEIADSLAADHMFPCHKTVDYSNDDSDGHITPDSKECVGASILSERSGFVSQHRRIAERLDMVPEQLDGSTIPWQSLEDWVLQGAERGHVETCSVVGPDCEAPAGYMNSNGSITYGEDEATEECEMCGEPVCSACISIDGFCDLCGDDE